jgi:integrase
MSKNRLFTGALATYLRDFLEEKHSLGYKYEEPERLLYVLDKMSHQFDCSCGLTEELCRAFTKRDPNWHQTTQEHRIALLRVLGEYLIRHDVPAYMVSNVIVTNLNEDFKPYIFTHQEMADIFSAADSIKPNGVNSHIFYPVLLRVQYGCGFRISETLGLRVKDVNLKDGIIHVLNAKNNRDRDIPVSGSVLEYLKWYSRKIHPVYNDDDYFFQSRWGNGHYEKTAVNHYFRNILSKCGIHHGGRKYGGPHLHNLRHTHCVHSLAAMLDNDLSHEVALPLICAYMGHTSLSATGRYLRLTAEAFPALMGQINKIYGDIMPDLEVKTEYEDEN